MHAPNQISLAAKASGEPEFREIGLGPWSETHPGEPRPDDPTSSNYDGRFDSVLLNDGDRRNVLDRYRYWTVAAIKADLDARGRHDFEVAVEYGLFCLFEGLFSLYFTATAGVPSCLLF